MAPSPNVPRAEEGPTMVDIPREVEQGGADMKQRKPYRKYEKYDLPVDPAQGDRATKLKIWSFKRPHMRAFHCSWFGFFCAFFIWFAIAPLLPVVKDTLGITKQDIWTSNICSVSSTVLLRFINGPLCDKYGPRITMSTMLVAASIPCAMIGLVNSTLGLCICRAFIGFAGSTFVMCQYWTSMMFAKNVVGTANALAGGWGNLGGGVTQLIMGSVLYPIFKTGMSESTAWRTVSIVPAVVTACVGITILFIADDSPKGNYSKLKKVGLMRPVSAANSFRQGAINFNTWILFVQYACCFGVELTMNNASAMYFVDNYGQSTESAAAIASIFGFMNIFARGLGGYTSDKLFGKLGMRGRLYVQVVALACEAALIFVFRATTTLWSSIVVLVFFSIFVQAAEGSTYSIVPFVDPTNTGSISGIVGAGGNIGAVAFGLAFRQLPNDKDAFLAMGITVAVSACLTVVINISGYKNLIFGKEDPTRQSAALAGTGGVLEIKVDKNLQFNIGDVEADAENLGQAEDVNIHYKTDLK